MLHQDGLGRRAIGGVLRHLREFELRDGGRHLRTVWRSAAWKAGESNSSTTSGRGVEGSAWLPARSTSTISVQNVEQLGGRRSSRSVNATSTRSCARAARRIRLYMRTAPPWDSGNGTYGLAIRTRRCRGARPGKTADVAAAKRQDELLGLAPAVAASEPRRAAGRTPGVPRYRRSRSRSIACRHSRAEDTRRGHGAAEESQVIELPECASSSRLGVVARRGGAMPVLHPRAGDETARPAAPPGAISESRSST